MFDSITEKLAAIFSKLKSRGKLSEKDIKSSLREIRLALLEADVNYLIVKNFISEIEKRALGETVQKSLAPGQQIVKIVNEQLIALMKSDAPEMAFPKNKTTKIIIVGLQGSGKTTACAKLALHYKKQNFNPLLVAADIYRPAAIKQLETLGKSIEVPIYSENSKNISKIAKNSLKFADKNQHNLIIFDTAGRLHIDDKMMSELENLAKTIKPEEVLYIADSMTGQDAVNSAKEFNSRLNLTGLILTKLDGDARGGAAISIRAITQKPIRFVSVGEKLNDLEPFHPDRMASRILGMGDMLTLIEKAESVFEKDEAEKLEKKLRKNLFTLEDFLTQLRQMQKMGSLDEILKMMPGANSKMMKNINVDEKDIKHIEAIVLSMTKMEREHPEIINGSRRQRIANGSGTSLQKVNQLLKQFEQMKKMMKNFNKGKLKFGNQFLPF
ncbi:MAG: signal recognition particle protein, partial [Candidatus Cloacimonetes bacterium]|nr:signal recognition particle protein [Candidatus Cloacimonadota bacterium]